MSNWWEVLDKDMDWRFEELSAIKLKILDEAPPKGKQPNATFKALIRALWAMLYAHYEGYWSKVMSLYLERLETLGVSRQECCESLMRFSLQHHLKDYRRGGVGDEKLLDFFKEGLSRILAARIDFQRNKNGEYVLKGYANLWPEDLAESIDSVGVRRTIIQKADARLFQLVDRRNDIAHGKQTPVVDLAEYQKYENHVKDVMYEIAIHTMDAITKREYLRDVARHERTEKLAYRLSQQHGGSADANWFEAERLLATGDIL